MVNRSIILTALVLGLLFTVPARADFEGGMKAYHAKDYATAAWLLLPEAKAGNAKAQRLIGYMYEKGKGLPKVPKRAFHKTSLPMVSAGGGTGRYNRNL